MNFKKPFVIALGATLLSSSVYADKGFTKHHYKTVIQRTPYTVEVCNDVVVGGDRTGDTIRGSILGAIIGHQLDHDNGAKVGGVLGGMIGHDNSNARGSLQRQCRTETRYESEEVRVYSHSTRTFWENGRKYTVRFYRNQ